MRKREWPEFGVAATVVMVAVVLCGIVAAQLARMAVLNALVDVAPEGRLVLAVIGWAFVAAPMLAFGACRILAPTSRLALVLASTALAVGLAMMVPSRHRQAVTVMDADPQFRAVRTGAFMAFLAIMIGFLGRRLVPWSPLLLACALEFVALGVAIAWALS